MDDKIKKALTTTLKTHAKALGMPSGSTEIFIKKSIAAAEKSLKKRKIITDQDISRTISKELTKYSSNLAYVYKNYDKII